MGCIRVPIKPTELHDHKIEKGNKARISFSIEWVDYPKSSRLKGVWRVCIQKATNLRYVDMLTSDPYCIITAVSNDRRHCYDQTTSVIPNTLNPIWNEFFEIPVMKSNRELEHALQESGIEYDNVKGILQSDKWLEKHVPLNHVISSSSVKSWSDCVSSAAFCH